MSFGGSCVHIKFAYSMSYVTAHHPLAFSNLTTIALLLPSPAKTLYFPEEMGTTS